MSYVESTGPQQLPVPIDRARKHLRITGTDDDTEIRNLLGVARRVVERDSGHFLITRTVAKRYHAFPESILLRGPVASVTSIQHIDSNGDTQTLDAAEYQTDLHTNPAAIKPAYAYVWPTTRSGTYNAVTVTYQAGHGDAPEDVPDELQQAVLLMLGSLWEHRQDSLDWRTYKLEGNAAYDALVWSDRVFDHRVEDDESP